MHALAPWFGLSQRSSPRSQRYSSGHISAKSRRAINALISRNASAPRAAGSDHSISLKRTARTADAQKRLGNGHMTGTALPMSHSSTNAAFSSTTWLNQRPRADRVDRRVGGVPGLGRHALGVGQPVRPERAVGGDERVGVREPLLASHAASAGEQHIRPWKYGPVASSRRTITTERIDFVTRRIGRPPARAKVGQVGMQRVESDERVRQAGAGERVAVAGAIRLGGAHRTMLRRSAAVPASSGERDARVVFTRDREAQVRRLELIETRRGIRRFSFGIFRFRPVPDIGLAGLSAEKLTLARGTTTGSNRLSALGILGFDDRTRSPALPLGRGSVRRRGDDAPCSK